MIRRGDYDEPFLQREQASRLRFHITRAKEGIYLTDAALAAADTKAPL